MFTWCVSVHRCICAAKKNQPDATEWLIALITCSTCFGPFYTHHQELETICVCYYRLWCAVPWLLVVRGQVPDLQQPAIKASHTIDGNNTYSLELLMMGIEVPETCWECYKCNQPFSGKELVFLLYEFRMFVRSAGSLSPTVLLLYWYWCSQEVGLFLPRVQGVPVSEQIPRYRITDIWTDVRPISIQCSVLQRHASGRKVPVSLIICCNSYFCIECTDKHICL
jgi:hypothetical protein